MLHVAYFGDQINKLLRVLNARPGQAGSISPTPVQPQHQSGQGSPVESDHSGQGYAVESRPPAQTQNNRKTAQGKAALMSLDLNHQRSCRVTQGKAALMSLDLNHQRSCRVTQGKAAVLHLKYQHGCTMTQGKSVLFNLYDLLQNCSQQGSREESKAPVQQHNRRSGQGGPVESRLLVHSQNHSYLKQGRPELDVSRSELQNQTGQVQGSPDGIVSGPAFIESQYLTRFTDKITRYPLLSGLNVIMDIPLVMILLPPKRDNLRKNIMEFQYLTLFLSCLELHFDSPQVSPVSNLKSSLALDCTAPASRNF
eukprot:g53519.t1